MPKYLTKELQNSNDVLESDVASLARNRVLGAVTSNDCKTCSLIMGSRSNRKTGFFVGLASTENNCLMTYKLFMSGEAIPEFLQSLHEGGVSYKISEIAKMTAPKTITQKQKRVMKSARRTRIFRFS